MLRVVPIAAFFLILIWIVIRIVSLNTLKKEITENLSTRTNITAIAVKHKISDLRDYLKLLASNDLVINALIDFNARHNYLPTFFKSLKFPDLENARLYLTDYKGRQIVSNLNFPKNFQESVALKKAMNKEEYVEINDLHVMISIPVLYGGFPEGMIIIILDRDSLHSFFNIESTLIDFAIIFKDMDFLYTTTKDFKSEIMDKTSETWIKIKKTVPSYENTLVICGIKKDLAYAQYHKMENFLFAAMILDLIALVIGIFFSARLTANPLASFVNILNTARESEKNMPNFPEQGTVEIKSLARAFNNLNVELEQARKESLNKAIESGRVQLSAMVLHNIGNAVTPLNVHLEQMDIKNFITSQDYLNRSYNELKENKDTLTEYVSENPRGIEIFKYMGELINGLKELIDDHGKRIKKAANSVTYISEILSLQQNHAPSKNELKEKTGFNKIINTALEIQNSEIRKRKIKINFQPEKNEKNIFIDKSRLLQVVVNLLKNSIEAIDMAEKETEAKEITVSVFTTENHSGFIIKDTGIGIEESKINKIFEFGESAKGSSGMGLYYCKMFIEANNGEISVESPGLKKGASFKILFNI